MDENKYGPAFREKTEKVTRWVFKKSGKLPVNWDSNILKGIKNFFKGLFR